MAYDKIIVPREGNKITINDDLSLYVPNDPIIPFIEGDGIGVDITPVMKKVVDSAVKKAYGSEKKIYWMEVYCGEKASKIYNGNTLPEETLQALEAFIISIKGPLNIAIEGIDTKAIEIKTVEAEVIEIQVNETRADEAESNEAEANEAVEVATGTVTETEKVMETVTEITEKVEEKQTGKPTIYEAISYSSCSDEPSENKHAGQDKANPTALILAAKMMLRDLGWTEASKLIARGVEGAIANKTVTYDFESMLEPMSDITMEDVTVISCSAFGEAVISEM